MEMHECMGQKCLFVSQPKLLPVDFRGSTSYVLSFFAGAMALIAHAYSLMRVNRASNSHLGGNEWTDYVQQLVDFAHAFPKFMNNKTRQCIPEFLPNIFRVLEGLAGYPTAMLEQENSQLRSTIQKLSKLANV